MDRQFNLAGFQELQKFFGFLVAFTVLLLGVFSLMLYMDARKLGPEERLEKLAGGGLGSFDVAFVVLVLTGMALLSRYRLFHAFELDAMLVSPLTEAQIFWHDFQRLLRPLLIFAAVTCLPFWAHLLGLDAGVWLFVATAAMWLGFLVLLLATAAFLALAGTVACWLPLAAVGVWSLSTGRPVSGAGLDVLARAMAWHPVAFSLLAVAVACFLVLGLDRLLVRHRYSRDALISRRDRPMPWWQGLDTGGTSVLRSEHRPDRPEPGWRLAEAETSGADTAGTGTPERRRSGSGAWLVARMGPRVHGLWRLVQRDEAPEAFAWRIPWAVALGTAWLAAAYQSLGDGRSDQDLLWLIGLLIAWGVSLMLLATPSGRPWKAGRVPAEMPIVAYPPLHEVFPVGPRTYTAALFCCVSFHITLSLLLFAPFVLLAPFSSDSAIRWLVGVWLVLELFLGLMLIQVSPRLDSRRPGLAWWRALAVAAAVVVGTTALFWLLFALGENEHFNWIMAACRLLFRDHPAASVGLVALLVALVELLAILVSLRNHEQRRFDAAW